MAVTNFETAICDSELKKGREHEVVYRAYSLYECSHLTDGSGVSFDPPFYGELIPALRFQAHRGFKVPAAPGPTVLVSKSPDR